MTFCPCAPPTSLPSTMATEGSNAGPACLLLSRKLNKGLARAWQSFFRGFEFCLEVSLPCALQNFKEKQAPVGQGHRQAECRKGPAKWLRIKVLATTPDNRVQSSTHMMEGKNLFLQIVFWLLPLPSPHTIINKYSDL